MIVQETFLYKRVTATAPLFAANSPSSCVSGFLCTTAGNVTLQDAASNDIVSVLAVTPGQFVNFPCACPNGATIVLSGGCVGTVFYNA